MANKYLIILDLSTRAYSVEYTLLHITNSKEAAAAWVRKHPIIKSNDGGSDIDLRKIFDQNKWLFGRNGYPRWESDDDIAKVFVKEFTGEPLVVGYYEE